jgi:hypothetical protein
MAFQSVPQTIEVQWRFVLHSVQMQYRINIDIGKTPSQADCDQLTSQAWDAWLDYMRPVMGTAISLRSTYARDLQSSPGFESTLFGAGSPLAGLVGEVVEDGQQCINLRFDAGLTGRSTRGRVYIPSPTTSDIASGEVDGTRLARYLIAFIDLVTETAFGIGTHVIVSRIANGLLRPTGVTYPVQNYGASSVIGSQNNRRVGV